MSIDDKLKEYFQKERVGSVSLQVNDPLLTSGLIDSLAMVKLLTFIEQEFGVQVMDADFEPENFETISNISAMIERMRQ